MTPTLLLGPMNDTHTELGASFAEFGGWSMPVAYAGTVAEHTAVRETVGIFDVSHLGKALITGPGASDFVNSVFTNDLTRIGPGKAQYTLCTNADGGVVDDLIAYYVSDEELFLVPNAANTRRVVEILKSAAPQTIQIENQHRDFGVIAVQGPRSADVVGALGLPTDMEYMAFADASVTINGANMPVRVCRTGYTGEHGYELIPRWQDSAAIFDALLDHVRRYGGQPAGLGARDTLRTEMGYPLHGHELSVNISPLEARTGWAIGWKKPTFVGREVLASQKQSGAPRSMWGLKALDRGIPRAGLSVLSQNGETIGVCTSGTFSPTLKVGIALALINASAGVSAGDVVSVDVRGRSVACEVVKPPFVDTKTK